MGGKSGGGTNKKSSGAAKETVRRMFMNGLAAARPGKSAPSQSRGQGSRRRGKKGRRDGAPPHQVKTLLAERPSPWIRCGTTKEKLNERARCSDGRGLAEVPVGHKKKNRSGLQALEGFQHEDSSAKRTANKT